MSPSRARTCRAFAFTSVPSRLSRRSSLSSQPANTSRVRSDSTGTRYENNMASTQDAIPHDALFASSPTRRFHIANGPSALVRGGLGSRSRGRARVDAGPQAQGTLLEDRSPQAARVIDDLVEKDGSLLVVPRR